MSSTRATMGKRKSLAVALALSVVVRIWCRRGGRILKADRVANPSQGCRHDNDGRGALDLYLWAGWNAACFVHGSQKSRQVVAQHGRTLSQSRKRSGRRLFRGVACRQGGGAATPSSH